MSKRLWESLQPAEAPERDESECFRHADRYLCENCGQGEREAIVDGSGYPADWWEHAMSADYPQRAACPADTACAECGRPVDFDPAEEARVRAQIDGDRLGWEVGL